MNQTTIFLVEDNLKLANYIKDYLSQAGYQVYHQSRGDKAVYHIIKTQPDIVILDIMLPKFNGIQVCQSIRPHFLGLILMLTALGENENQITGFNSGADDYVIKPIDPEVLLARIKALQRRHSPKIVQKILNFGFLQIDLIQHQVKLGNIDIPLNH